MAWYTSAIVLLIIGVGAAMGIAGAILKKLGVEEAADILEKVGLGIIVGILIGFNILIILSSFEILEPNAWAVGGFLLMLLIFLSLYKSGGAGSVYMLSVLVLLFGYVMTGPYSGYVKHTLGDVAEPLGIGWEALKGTLGDIKLMITDPMAYMQKQRQTTVRPEKPAISYPKGVELKSLNVMPDAVPIGERFYIQVMAENEGDITATNVNITASCKDRCELGDNAITMLPKESEQPKTLKQYEVILGRFGPFNATGEEKDVGREAKVEINLSYEHASNSTLLVEVMSDNEVKRIMTDPIEREKLFKPVVATGKNAPAMLALSVGYQPLFAGEPQVLLVSVVNKRPDGNVILPKGSTVEITLPGSIGSDLKCHGSEVFNCKKTGESATCTVKKERTIEPKEYYPITCEFTANSDVNISTTDIITGKLSKYVFETSKEKGATIMMSYKPETSEEGEVCTVEDYNSETYFLYHIVKPEEFEGSDNVKEIIVDHDCSLEKEPVFIERNKVVAQKESIKYPEKSCTMNVTIKFKEDDKFCKVSIPIEGKPSS